MPSRRLISFGAAGRELTASDSLHAQHGGDSLRGGKQRPQHRLLHVPGPAAVGLTADVAHRDTLAGAFCDGRGHRNHPLSKLLVHLRPALLTNKCHSGREFGHAGQREPGAGYALRRLDHF